MARGDLTEEIGNSVTAAPMARIPTWSCMYWRAKAVAAGLHSIFTGRCRAVRP